MKKQKSLLFCFLLATTLQAQVNTFTFNINGTVPAGFSVALNEAAQRWHKQLQIHTPVKINVFTVNTTLVPFSAITLANGRQNYTNAPLANILYPTALANQLAKKETNPGEYDMDIYFNLATSYYYGTDVPAPFEMDFITLAMHEIGHGLGFYSDGYVDAGGIGSFGGIPANALFPLTTSFPWRGQDSVPSIFDLFIIKAGGLHLTDITPKYSTLLGDSILHGPLYFDGPDYLNPCHSGPIRLAGGEGSFSLGIDLLHLHSSNKNNIMSYSWGFGDTVRTPASCEIALLNELGWNIEASPLSINAFSVGDFVIYPNPSDGEFMVTGKTIQDIELRSVHGALQKVSANQVGEETEVRFSSIEPGLYLLSVKIKGKSRPEMRRVLVK